MERSARSPRDRRLLAPEAAAASPTNVTAPTGTRAEDPLAGRHRDQVVAELAAVQDPELAHWIAAEEWAARANPGRVQLIRRGAGIGGLLVAFAGLTVWLGWAIGSPTLTSVIPGLVTMKWWTATCFVALGTGIAIPTVRDTRATRRVALVLGVLVALLAATFLFEHVSGISLGHDNPFGLDPLPVADHPGRMAQPTAVGLILLGTSLALHKMGRLRLAQTLACVPTALGFLALLGYVFDVSPLYSGVRFASMAAHTALALMVAGLAILTLRSDEGHMAIVSSNTAGGRLARRLIPPALLVPPLLGWVANLLAARRVVDVPFALAVMATAVSALAILAIWREAAGLSTIDVQRAGTVAALRRVRAAEESRAALATALEEHARRTEAILQGALDAFIGLDHDGRITSWNPAAERLYGWSAAEAVGTRLDELLPVFRSDGSRLDARVDGAFLEHAIVRGPVVYSVVRKDGSIAEVESRVWSQEVPGGRSYTAIVRDVAQRQAAQRELLELNRSLDEFAAVAAHDLRGPIRRDPRLPRAHRGLGDRTRRHRRARDRRPDPGCERPGLRLIDDLLAYSRAGRAALTTTRVDLTELARSVGDDVAARVGRPCRIDVAEMPPAEGDASALRQVLTNLLFNAVHYGPSDCLPHVTVSAAPAVARRELLVRVTDNGRGIPPEDRERIFEMFQRGTNTGGASGTGVGLALCRRVVERHGGRIWVEDAPDGAGGTVGTVGTSMCFTLPRHFDPLDPAPTGPLRAFSPSE